MSGAIPPLPYAFATFTGPILHNIRSRNAGTYKSNDKQQEKDISK